MAHMVENLADQNGIKNIRTAYGIIFNLMKHGVRHIFGIPDGHTLALYDAMAELQGIPNNEDLQNKKSLANKTTEENKESTKPTTFIQHILVNDERTAVFAADAYARVTGMLGVCDAGAAGSMNFPVGLAEANGAGSPVLALVGTVKSKDLLRNVPHDINVCDTFKPITKWSSNVTHTENVARFLNYAITQAISGRPGSVGLVFPEDILNSAQLPIDDFIPLTAGSCSINSCRVTPSESELDQAIQLIQSSKQPVLFTGGGAVRSGAFAEVKKISQMLKSPVFSTIDGKGIMIDPKYDNPDSNSKNYYFGTVGLFGEKPNHVFLKKKADLIIVIGNRLTEDDTAYFTAPPQDLKMIHIDIDPAEIGLSYRAYGVVGDPKAALTAMIERFKTDGIINPSSSSDSILKEREENIHWLRDQHVSYRKRDDALWMNAEPIKPQRVLKAISDAMDPEDYLITDASASSRWIGPYFPVKGVGRKIITARGVGPTGFGLGALIGTHFACTTMYSKEQMPKLVLFTGDGGLMNAGVADFETLVKYNINCTIVIINNSALGFVKYGQGLLYNLRYHDTDRPTTDFSKIIQSFGGNGLVIEKIMDLDRTIREAIMRPGVNLIDVRVDPAELLPKNFYV